MNICNVTAVIPTYKRLDQLLKTLEKILLCNPQPNEIIIHIDANDTQTEEGLKNHINNSNFNFQNIKIIKNPLHVGPGGGRNIAINQSSNPIIASFDDDSYPLDTDYFQQLINIFDSFPKAAVITAKIFHINETITPTELNAKWVSDFIGCGCAYRKEVFQQTSGYVNLPIAYGMEEVDLSLRLHDMGWSVLESYLLRVFHNTQLEHHQNPHITAASIANQILLTYLRYPIIFWWLGIGQCISRIFWLVKHGRTSGILTGLILIPKLVQKYHQERQPISSKSLLNYLYLRKNTYSIFE